jgi:hypothetical protein
MFVFMYIAKTLDKTLHIHTYELAFICMIIKTLSIIDNFFYKSLNKNIACDIIHPLV